MKCPLHLHRKRVATHYVGATGTEYPKEEYVNHGRGGIYKGKKDLPMSEYPFTYKYSDAPAFKCCEICSC